MKRKQLCKELSVISIGPGDPSFLNQATMQEIENADPLILRTGHHTITAFLDQTGKTYCTLDSCYDQEDNFDQLNRKIAQNVWDISQHGQKPVYAVPDFLTDRTIDSVYSEMPSQDYKVRIIPGFSYADYYLSQCRDRIFSSDLRIVSSSEFCSSVYDPDTTVLITEMDQYIYAGEIKRIVSDLIGDETEVLFFSQDASPIRIPVYEIDRQKKYNHLSAVLIPSTDYLHRSRHTMKDLIQIMHQLRTRCPWDSAQTHRSLQQYLIEEAWECICAMDEKDYDHFADELGDLLFQIVFHASIGEDFDEFTITDVFSHICSKMILRHPHVFGNSTVSSSKDVSDSWEKIKMAETGSRTVSESMNDVPSGLPALKYAIKICKKLKAIRSFHPTEKEFIEIIKETAYGALKGNRLNTETVGNLLFICAYMCCLYDDDAELILHKTADRFKTAFSSKEKELKVQGKSIDSLTFKDLYVYLEKESNELQING